MNRKPKTNNTINKKIPENLVGKFLPSQGVQGDVTHSELTDIDRKILRLLLETEGAVPTHEISQQSWASSEYRAEKKEETGSKLSPQALFVRPVEIRI